MMFVRARSEQMEKTTSGHSAGRNGKRDAEGIGVVHSHLVFKTLLRHERSRSDRDGSEFSLAIFDVTGLPSKRPQIKRLVSIIREKMRSIDEIGWLDAGKIGVLLPLTSFQGGQRFASRVLESDADAPGLIPCMVCSYPAHWLPGGNGRSDKESRRPGETVPGDPGPEGAHFSSLFGRAFSLRIPAWKRWMDVAGSVVLLVLLSPLFLLIAVSIKIISPGKALFRQYRVGYQGKLFTFLKFRTMHEKNDTRAHEEYLKELIRGGTPMAKLDAASDPRIIPGGKILRKTSLDELPQLINVLRGEMSLVGPRPCIPYEAEEYLRWHTRRFDILPGMTGLWQVSGKNRLSFEQMIRLDISYAKGMSPLLDMKILLLTLPTVIGLVFEAGMRKINEKRRGTSGECCHDGSATGTLGNA